MARSMIRPWGVAALLALAGCDAARLLPDLAPLSPGDYRLRIDVAGVTREYLLHVPPQYDGTTPLPLVVMLHGGFGSAEQAAESYGWREKADAAGFLAAFPNGLHRAWNAEHCCGRPRRDEVDDVGFIVAMVAELRANLAVDGLRIFATGMSNGAMMSHRLGAERPDLFAAIGPVAGTVGGQADDDEPVQMPPAPGAPVACVVIHGLEDMNVLYEGGESPFAATPGRIDLSVQESVDFWVTANGCATPPTETERVAGEVTQFDYAAPSGHGDVRLLRVANHGHAWPGTQRTLAEQLLGLDQASLAINATDELWAFFATHSKPD